MPLKICPRCRRRIVVPKHGGDVIHECQGTDALKKESVPIMGDWTDPDGTTGKPGAVNFQGLANRLQGTVAGIQGEDAEPRNVHGHRKSTHRTRQHYEYIKGVN